MSSQKFNVDDLLNDLESIIEDNAGSASAFISNGNLESVNSSFVPRRPMHGRSHSEVQQVYLYLSLLLCN